MENNDLKELIQQSSRFQAKALEALEKLQSQMEGHKALIAVLISLQYADNADLFLSILEDVRGQNEIAADQIEKILASLHVDHGLKH